MSSSRGAVPATLERRDTGWTSTGVQSNSRSIQRHDRPGETACRRRGPRAHDGNRPRGFGGCRGPQPPAGKQVTRLPLRGNGLSHSSSDRAFVAPTGGTRGPRESFARPFGAAPPGPRAARAPYPGGPYSRGPLLATPSPASYIRPSSTAKGARRHGPTAIGGIRSRGRVQTPRDPP